MATIVDWGTDRQVLTDRVSVLTDDTVGRYPGGNSLVVSGDGEAIIIDPSIAVVERGGAHLRIDAVVNSHAHEDHIAGNGLFSDASVHIHHADRLGVVDLDGLMEVYGLPEPIANQIPRPTFVEDFYYTPRPDAVGFGDGHRFDLGGVTVEAVHLPGHTRGHSGFRISDGVFFVSDIDLTGFGPYYGDMWSDLDDFETSLERVRDEDAQFYVTSHHRGVISGRPAFIKLLDDFHAVIHRRHATMLEFLATPHTVDDMVAHRFIYRPHVELAHAEPVERRSAELHLGRMLARGEAVEVEPGRFRAA